MLRQNGIGTGSSLYASVVIRGFLKDFSPEIDRLSGKRGKTSTQQEINKIRRPPQCERTAQNGRGGWVKIKSLRKSG